MISNKKKRKLSAQRIAIFIVIIFLFSITISSGEWTSVSLTSIPKKVHEVPSVAIVERTVHVAWNTWVDNNKSIISYKRSIDNGKTWGNTVNLSTNTTNAVSPVISASGKTVHVAWRDFRNGNPEIYYIHSLDNGDTWNTSQRLTYDDPRPTNIYDVNIASEGTQVYLAWKDYRTGSSEIFFKMSNDSGKTWNSDQRLTYDYRASYNPVLAIEGNNLYIAFDDYGTKTNVCILRSTTDGETWDAPRYITMNNTKARYLQPSIAVSHNIVYLVWEDEPTGHPEIYFTKSLDGGIHYDNIQQLTVNSTGSTNPKIYAYNQSITIIWQHAHNQSFDIYFLESNDSGYTLSTSQPLLIEGNYYDAEIAGDGDNVHVVCQKYYEPGWADIVHSVNTGGKPVVNSLSLSSPFISPQRSVHIIVDGYDPMYNNSEVTCLVQYSSIPDEWQGVNVTFTNNTWESIILFSNTLNTEVYTIRTQLVNPDGSHSNWKLGSIVVPKHDLSNTPSSTPGFTFISSIIGIIVLFLMNRKYYNRKKGR